MQKTEKIKTLSATSRIYRHPCPWGEPYETATQPQYTHLYNTPKKPKRKYNLMKMLK
jgi:hypothetical protein